MVSICTSHSDETQSRDEDMGLGNTSKAMYIPIRTCELGMEMKMHSQCLETILIIGGVEVKPGK